MDSSKDRRIVLVAGTPGTDTDLAVRRIVEYADAHGQAGKWIKAEKFEQVILDAHNKTNPEKQLIDIIPLLEQPKAALRHLWRSAGQRLCSKMKDIDSEAELVLVPIHLVWFNHHVRDYINVIDAELVRVFSEAGIRHVLCLIDDANDVYARLAGPNRLYDPNAFPLTPREAQEGRVFVRWLEVLEWRRREIAESEALADHLASPFTLLATKHQRCVGYRCLAGDPQAYLSHPISELRRLERSQQGENASLNKTVRTWLWEFQETLSRQLPLLQPTCIDEYRLAKSHDGIGLGPRFYAPDLYSDCLVPPAINTDRETLAPVGDKACPFSARAVSELVESQISYQVTARDLQLVAQAPYLILFRPHFNGGRPGGVWQEVAEFVKIGAYCKHQNRRIFVLESAIDTARVPPRQFLERLVVATQQKRWSGELNKDDICDYLAQLSATTREQITSAAHSRDLDLAGKALASVLGDLEMDTAWELVNEDSASRKPLSDAGSFPQGVADKNKFLESLLDSGFASEQLLPSELTTRIVCDDHAPADLADVLLQQIRSQRLRNEAGY